MAWKRQDTSTSIDVDLGDFSYAQLLQALIDGSVISESEAEQIQKRAKDLSKPVLSKQPDTWELDVASEYLRRGNRDEAVLHLERYLGRDWVGTLQ